ncbi:hypothetical protein DFP72DRAFT_1169857 [Ephemerocybe angulata]|uniref:Uncharacterized protein n=1 Tax=Ephemerocybe angulata TaxID=980116 RepID=A0A8H6M6K8_9AGAR|nr:hypothetical protein DFP72DRAFT_1169857 [Tulosesus angulatus]
MFDEDIRKSSSNWITEKELTEFNIKIIFQDTQAFFGTADAADLPVPENISPIIWNHEKAPPGPIPKPIRHFFRYLEDAMVFPYHQSFVIDFTMFLLGMLDYDDGRRVLHTWKDMPFFMPDGMVDVKACATVIEQHDVRLNQYILLVKEDNYSGGGIDCEPRLIAEAIGAFYQNNKIRTPYGKSPLESQTFPAITMVGTAARFYKITITRELADAVEIGLPVENETIVHRFMPPVPNRFTYNARGMVPLENRRLLLKCFEAFKQFMLSGVVAILGDGALTTLHRVEHASTHLDHVQWRHTLREVRTRFAFPWLKNTTSVPIFPLQLDALTSELCVG